MSTPQLSYSRSFSRALAGMPADSDDFTAEAKINAEASNLPVGIALRAGSSEPQANLLTGAADAVIGIAVNSFARDPDDLTGSQAIKVNAGFNVMVRGRMYVTTEETVAIGDPVYVRHTSDGGSNTQPGTFRKSTDSGRARLLKGARWTEGATSGGVATLYFDAAAEASLGDLAEITYDQASVSATTTKKIWQNRSDRNFLVESVSYDNPTGLVADVSNYFLVEVQNVSAQAAKWSTQTGQEGALAADTFVSFTNAVAANRLLAPGAVMNLKMTLTGTQTLPAGRLCVHGRYI